MINRVLIRVKAVQTLYSYLLVEKDFALEPQPASPTKEKRFAYSLYLDMMLMMVETADGIERRDHSKPLMDSRFVKGIMSDDRMRSLTVKYQLQPFRLRTAVDTIIDKVKESSIYKNYIKYSDREEGNRDIDVWRDIFNDIIIKDRRFNTFVTERENYSPRGVERAIELVNDTFSNFYASHSHHSTAVTTLDKSLDAARELYFRLLSLPIALTDLRDRQIDDARHKFLPSEEDRNPNLRFVENQLVQAMANNEEIRKYCSDHKISWMEQDRTILNTLLKAIMASDIYKEYMNRAVTDFNTDVEFWRNIFKHVIINNAAFLEEMEDKSVFWNDDLEIITTFVLKTFKRFAEALTNGTESDAEGVEPVLPMFKDREDARFGAELITDAIKNKTEYRGMINRFIDPRQWDSERLALMDVVILLCAIAEVIHFPKIPTSVTVNEYIEICKSYSSPRSASFIHGVLGKVITSLREEGRINKN